jgi:hypothetical protein
MRVILAALFVFVCLVTIGIFIASFKNQPPPWWAILASVLMMLISLPAALVLFNNKTHRPRFRRRSLEEIVVELEASGSLERRSFQAKRSFAVEEYEDEGLHYFIELADGHVLYLEGQYLYDYTAIDDDPDINRPRSFPCTEFEILRHKDEGYVLDIVCGGSVLEPELTTAAFTREEVRRGLPEDGQVIADRSYDSLKQERAAMQ